MLVVLSYTIVDTASIGYIYFFLDFTYNVEKKPKKQNANNLYKYFSTCIQYTECLLYFPNLN